MILNFVSLAIGIQSKIICAIGVAIDAIVVVIVTVAVLVVTIAVLIVAAAVVVIIVAVFSVLVVSSIQVFFTEICPSYDART